MAEAPTFFLQEVASTGDVVVLEQHALPFQPLEVVGEMRAEFTWYPGNPVATVQILGAKEGETTISGKWSDRFLGLAATNGRGIAAINGEPLTTAEQIVKAIDTIRRRGQLVSINWGEVFRVGILLKFVQRWIRREDVEWEMTFQWIAQEDVQVPPVFAQADATSSLVALLDPNIIEEDISLIDRLSEYAAIARSGLASVRDAYDKMVGSVELAADLALTPVDLARSTIALTRAMALSSIETAKLLRAEAAVSIAALDTQLTAEDDAIVAATAPAEGVTLGATFTRRRTLLTSVHGQRISFLRDALAVQKSYRAAARASASNAFVLESQLEKQGLLGVYVGKEGDDLRFVSSLFYAVPDEWQRIKRFNALDTSKVSVGQILLIPRLSGSEVQS